MAVAVIVATFGDYEWIERAQRHAIPSAEDQAPTYHFHCATLAAARNSGLRQALIAGFDRVVFLDADDQLEPGYIEAMEAAKGDVCAPRVRYVQGMIERPPHFPRVAGHRHECEPACLEQGNFIVVGAAVKAKLAYEVGGWREFAWSEDWDLWTRCWQAGGTIERVPNAIYRAYVRPDSRNRGPSREFRNRVHWEIHRANFPEKYVDAA